MACPARTSDGQNSSEVSVSLLKQEANPECVITECNDVDAITLAFSAEETMGICTESPDQTSKKETCDLRCQREQLRADREKLQREREVLHREKQTLRSTKELLQAERQSLEAEREIFQAEKDAFCCEKEIMKAQKQLVKSERDAVKAERRALEAERKALDVERMTVKAQAAVLKAERYELELERENTVISAGSGGLKRERCDDDVHEDGANDDEIIPDLCIQFEDPPVSAMECDDEKLSKAERSFYQCEVCSKMYRSHKSFTRHLKIHTAGFHCGTCQKPFQSQDELNLHKQEHSRSKLICPVCGDALVSKYSLEKHRRMKHAQEELLACTFPGCKKRFFNEQLLSDHMNVHTQRKPYHCLKCGRQYASALALIAHKKGCGNPDAHVCDICGVRMSARSTLAEHKRRRHTEERYTCPCGQRYAWRSGIIRHKKKCPVAAGE